MDTPERAPDGSHWKLVKRRVLGRGEVRMSESGEYVLRTGPKRLVEQEAADTRKLERLGYPVPRFVMAGTSGALAYFIETSLGVNCIADLFMREYADKGRVAEDTFTAYIAISKKMLEAQIRSATPGKDELWKGLYAESVLEENPDLPRERLDAAISRARGMLSAYPNCLSHGDFNAFNIFPEGVIDFEHSFIAPVGFDVVNNVFFGQFFDLVTSLGPRKRYGFTQPQVERYLSVMDETAVSAGLPALSAAQDAFLFLKAVWSLSHMKELAAERPDGTELWEWRRGVFRDCIERFEKGEPIRPGEFSRISPLPGTERILA